MKKTYPHIHCKSPPAIERGLNKQNPSLFVESSRAVVLNVVESEMKSATATGCRPLFVCVLNGDLPASQKTIRVLITNQVVINK